MVLTTLGAAPTGSYIARMLGRYAFVHTFTVQPPSGGAVDGYNQPLPTYGAAVTGQAGRFRDLAPQELIDAQQGGILRATAWLDCPLGTPIAPRARISDIRDRTNAVADPYAWRVTTVLTERGFGPEYLICHLTRDG